MGDTNVKSNKSEKNSYTNLGSAYIVKTIVLLFVGCITIAFADTFRTTFIGALTTLSGISFDLVIVAISNNGPRQKWPRKMAKIASSITIGICFCILLYFVTNGTELVNNIRDYYISRAGERADIGCWVIKAAILIFSLIGPITEYFFNKPNDSLDDEES